MRKLTTSFFVFVLLLATQAGANVITSPPPGGAVVAIPAIPCGPPTYDCFSPGPFSFGPGITWTSTNDGSSGAYPAVFGYTDGYGFGTNGAWTGALGPMAGVDDSNDFFGVTDSMTFAFSTPISAVGGFLNYYLSPGGNGTPTTIAIYDATWKLIDSFDLSFVTNGGNDTGAFYGFQENTQNISYFVLTDNYIGITNLTIVSPEPGSILLLGSGLIGAISYGRRRLGR